MNQAWAMREQGIEVLACAVANMLCKIVLRIDFVKGAHERVTICLGDNRGGGD